MWLWNALGLFSLLARADDLSQEWPDRAPARIIARNEIIQVKVGRRVFISPHDHLVLNVENGHDCEVRVLQSPVEQTVGELNVDRFPCDFTENEVIYQHFGRSTPKIDRISLQIIYDTSTEKKVLPIQLEVEVLLEKYNIVDNHQVINVYQNMGTSDIIDQSIISFKYDPSMYDCFVRLPSPYRPNERFYINTQKSLANNYPIVDMTPPFEFRFATENPRVGLWPRHGRLMNAESDMTCDEFVNSDVYYEHQNSHSSPNKDHQPLIIDLMDKQTGQLVDREMYDLQVHIRSGEPNREPGIHEGSNLILVANQYILTALTKEILLAVDEESDPNELIIELDEQPEHGYFISTDDRTRPILSFYQIEVHDHKIAYQPPADDSDNERLSRDPAFGETDFINKVNFRVIDPDGATSDWTPLYIRVKSRATTSPIALENNGLILYEGQERCIGIDNFMLADEDTDVRKMDVRVIDGMKHGDLLLRGRIETIFTGEDIELCDVIYKHDDSDTYVDNLILQINDGINTIETLFPIWIVPVDDQPPQIVRNLGAEIHRGGKAHLELEDADIDSDGPALYKLTSRLRKGELFVKQTSGEWAVSTSFTSTQLAKNEVQYVHNRQMGALTVDIEDLTLTAEDITGNVGPAFNYTIIINAKDDEPPQCQKVPCDLGMKVNEYETAPLRRSNFEYKDDTSPPEDVVFDLTQDPFDTATGEPYGRLLNADTLEPITRQFNQKQVNHLKVVYEAPNRDLGLVRRVIQFTFDVSDAMQNTLPDQTFTIDLMPVDNAEPVVTNNGIQVMQGASVVITTEKLDIEDTDTDLHMLSFMLLEQPGHGDVHSAGLQLHPSDEFFQPDLAANDVEYRHNDDESRVDVIKLLASDGMHQFEVNVNVIIIPRPVIPEPTQRNPSETTLVVPEKQSTELSRDKYFLTPPDDADKDITFTLVEAPEHGSLLFDGMELDEDSGKFGASDISNGRVLYRHNGPPAEIGPNEMPDKFRLLAQDKQGLAKPMDILTNVRIVPVDNQYPIVNKLRDVTVDEGGKAALNPSHVHISDEDTEQEDVICRIDPQPMSGFLENISPLAGSEKSRTGVAITDFKASDLANEYINYVQSIHKGYEPTDDFFYIACRDKANNESPKKRIGVIIKPVNDEEPKIEHSRWRVREGDLLNLDESLLNCFDMDIPEDELTFIVIDPPKHGRIIYLGGNTLDTTESIDSFTCMQLKYHEIGYEHDDSETNEDGLRLQLTDGVHAVEEDIKIDIISVDDETPRVKINRGIQMDFDQVSARIGAEDLSVTDLDSVDDELMLVITYVPQRGQLTYDDGTPQGKYLGIGELFTMDDLSYKRIVYTRNADSLASIDDQRDFFVFKVTDGFNDLIDRKFFINIEAGDKMFPMVFNEALELPEDGRRILTTTLLKASDLNSNDLDLIFNIIKIPIKGRLESTDSPGVKRDQFTMRELVGSKIRYVHTADDEIRMDAFEFSVTDGTNTVYRTFRVNILPIDNKLPIVHVSGITLNEGAEKLISPYELGIEDADTDDRKIEITVVGDCVHGTLNFNGNIMATEFTLADLKDNKITYKHDGSETTQDQFRFVVTDGSHREFYLFPELKKTHEGSVTFPINIVPVDDEPPRVIVNRTMTYVTENPDGSRTARLTNKHLRSSDRDSFNPELKYRITQPPQHGKMMKLSEANTLQPITEFYQKDLDKKSIVFELLDDVSATEDFFIFTLVDQGNNELIKQRYVFQWSFISLKQELIVVDEVEKELIITIQRRGFLGETSFVTVEADGALAEVSLDFTSEDVSSRQVQINPGQSEAVWKVKILDDNIYEESEDFIVKLSDPVMSIFEEPTRAEIEIIDPDDQSMVMIPDPQYTTIESIGKFRVPIKRVGDITKEFAVICSTTSGTAGGTGPIPLESFYDFISRPEGHQSVVRFAPGEAETFCEVTIIDDSLYEPEETFTVHLSQPTGGKIDPVHYQTEIKIAVDPADSPIVYFEVGKIDVTEDVGKVEFKVQRKGSDLSVPSSCIVRSRSPNIPTSLASRSRRDTDILDDLKYHAAQAGTDYVGISKTIHFDAEETEQTVSVVILDDVGSPVMEGLEQFEVYLSMPQDCVFGTPEEIVITIDDREDDKPEVLFRDAEVKVNERDGAATALIIRKGDLDHVTTVRCFTRQIAASVGEDYIERPNTDESIVTFKPGQTVAECSVTLVNDVMYENKEDFRLVLGTAVSDIGARIGEQGDTLIIITDDNDEPTVGFEKPVYEVVEPAEGQIQRLRICVVRTGDLTAEMEGRVHTKDGNAESGLDYVPISKTITIEREEDRCCFEVEILFDKLKEIRESFTVWIKDPLTEDGLEPTIKQGRTIVYIKQRDLLADVTFPIEPTVASLADYDRMAEAAESPRAGYPVVCVTACDPKNPLFEEVRALCEDERIDNDKTEYRWQISAPTGASGATHPMSDVSSNTFFTNVNTITLDSIYFTSGSRVQCHARAVKDNGEPGRESASTIVTISNDGLCPPRQEGVLGADPFSAKIRYVDASDPDHPNTVKVSIILPHSDGILPLISTRQLTNFEFTLSQDSTRTAGHSCSNLLLPDEVRTEFGFLTNATMNDKARTDADMMPYQYSSDMRGERTLQFYRNLNLEACIWEFENWFSMSELQQACGGEITTDGQVLNMVHSYVTLQIPLFVSYISHSPTRIPWRHYDLSTDLRLTFVYDTAKMWTEGIGTPPESELPGTFYPTSMKIRSDGRLVVRFKTVARFHGMFVANHPGSARESTITSTHHQDLTFSLTLERSDASFNYPEQQWSFISNYAVTDYSGDYTISLIPCTAGPDQKFTDPPKCNPRAPVDFTLPIRAQQVSDPVAEEFSLNTTFVLLSKRELWLADSQMQITESSDVAFPEGAQIYGRVQVDPVQSLGSGFSVHIEKVFLCSGRDGYIPKYAPSNSEYGCLADAPNLLYRFKVIDKEQPDTEDQDLNSVPFNAQLAIDDPNASQLSKQAGADGFQMDSTPLFQVNVGAEWYLHTIYTVRSSTRKVRRHTMVRRAAETDEFSSVGASFNRGTNMHQIPLTEETPTALDALHTTSSSWIVAAALGVIIVAILVVIVVRRKRRTDTDGRGAYASGGVGGAKFSRDDAYKPIVRGEMSSSSSSRSGTEV